MNNKNKTFFFARVFADTNLYKVSISDDQKFRYGAEVIINTEFGQDLAVITGWKTEHEQDKTKSYVSGALIRYATQEDKIKRKVLDKKSISIKAQINTLIDEFKLKMNLTHVLIPLSDDSICIYYTASNRVDFRNLLTEVRNQYKVKITFKHINYKERRSSFLFSSDLSLYNHVSF